MYIMCDLFYIICHWMGMTGEMGKGRWGVGEGSRESNSKEIAFKGKHRAGLWV